jgi:AcrR family transcriptional regulator
VNVADGRRRPTTQRRRTPTPPTPKNRSRILTTARTSFALGGYADTHVDTLATQAGVTSGMLYYYFGSKTGLYDAVPADARKQLNDSLINPILTITNHQPTLTTRLTTLVNILTHRATQDVDLHRLAFASDLKADHYSAVKTFRDGIHHDLQRLYTGIAGIDPGDQATPQPTTTHRLHRNRHPRHLALRHPTRRRRTPPNLRASLSRPAHQHSVHG